MWNASGTTHVGKVRNENQDRFLIIDDKYTAIVSDGMGGMFNGAVAAETVVSSVKTIIENLDFSLASEDLNNRLVEELEKVNASLYEDWMHMSGATLALVIYHNNNWIIVNAGDSDVFLYREDRFVRQSLPHNQFQVLFEQGLVEADNLHHPTRSMLTGFMGAHPPMKIFAQIVKAHSDDLCVICSDGLSGEIIQSKLAKLIAFAKKQNGFTVQKLTETLKEAALDTGGHDNIAVVALALK